MKAVSVDRSNGSSQKGKAPTRCFKEQNGSLGFTLIETLVATVILAVSLVLVMQLFSGALNSSAWSEQYTRGVFHAREKMDEMLLADELREGELEGEFDDGFTWHVEVAKVEPETEETVKLPYDAFTIKVDVAWNTGARKKHFEIDTLKTVQKVADDA